MLRLRNGLNLMKLAHLYGDCPETLYEALASVTDNARHYKPFGNQFIHTFDIKRIGLCSSVIPQQVLSSYSILKKHHGHASAPICGVHKHDHLTGSWRSQRNGDAV